MVFICLLFVCFIKDSGIFLERTVCSVSVSPFVWFPVQLSAREVNPEEDLMQSFHSLFSLGLGLPYAK